MSVHISTFEGNSESGKVRSVVLPLIAGLKHGIDIGFGGDPIAPSAITLDLPVENRTYFGNVGNYPQHLQGEAGNLYWFRDQTLDYVLSSHVLEDFANPQPLLNEWLRVLRPGGLLILVLPNEQKYKATCLVTGQPYNLHHMNEDMSLSYMLDYLRRYYKGQLEIVTDMEVPDDYSFLVIARKIG